MGGGGHLANAATQITGKTVDAVRKELIDLLTKTVDNSNQEDEEE